MSEQETPKCPEHGEMQVYGRQTSRNKLKPSYVFWACKDILCHQKAIQEIREPEPVKT